MARYGIFRISEDEEGREIIGDMIWNGDLYTQACEVLRQAAQTGGIREPSGMVGGVVQPARLHRVESINAVKILELDKRPYGNHPPKISPDQTM